MDAHGRVTGLRVERTQLQIPEGSKAAVAVGTGEGAPGHQVPQLTNASVSPAFVTDSQHVRVDCP
jgi:hypothetical protein